MSLPKSIKVTDMTTEFLKKLKINMIRVGASENALEISYAELMERIVKYFKLNNEAYINMVKEVSKDV